MKQITTPGGRYYQLDDGRYFPSVTTIIGACYPKGTFLQEWVGSIGNAEAERIKNEAGKEGTVVHDAIDSLIRGHSIQSTYLSEKGKRCIAAFLDWWDIERPQVIANEYFVSQDMPFMPSLDERFDDRVLSESEKVLIGWAGSVDFKCRLRSDNYENVWVIDFKTSKSLHDSYGAQIAAYIWADNSKDTPTRGAALHLGNGTRAGWSFKQYSLQKSWRMFELCLKMYWEQNPDPKPKQEVVYPDLFKLPTYGSATSAQTDIEAKGRNKLPAKLHN